jgi:hypothetical protein
VLQTQGLRGLIKQLKLGLIRPKNAPLRLFRRKSGVLRVFRRVDFGVSGILADRFLPVIPSSRVFSSVLSAAPTVRIPAQDRLDQRRILQNEYTSGGHPNPPSVDTRNERVFRTFGGGFTESAGIGNRNWTHERENPGCNHERYKSGTPTMRLVWIAIGGGAGFGDSFLRNAPGPKVWFARAAYRCSDTELCEVQSGCIRRPKVV